MWPSAAIGRARPMPRPCSPKPCRSITSACTNAKNECDRVGAHRENFIAGKRRLRWSRDGCATSEGYVFVGDFGAGGTAGRGGGLVVGRGSLEVIAAARRASAHGPCASTR